MNVIELTGHAESPWHKRLVQIGDSDLYSVDTSLKTDSTNQGYLRIGCKANSNDIDFIDFDGGPLITVGAEIGDYVVTEFVLTEKHDVLVRLKENENNN